MSDQSTFSDGDSKTAELRYPFDALPAGGDVMEVAKGVYWLRMPLPMSLDHINLWILEDGDGVVLVDTGLNTQETKGLWDQLFDGHIAGRSVTKIIVTHYHPDHIGLAGWLHKKTGAPIHITRTEFFMTRVLCLDVRAAPPAEVIAFFEAAGWDENLLDGQRKNGFGSFAKMVSELPISYHRIQGGDSLHIGGRDWEIWIGKGHAPEHACLYQRDLDVLISGDQVLPRISSNVSVYATEPEADPMSDWLQSLHKFKALPESCLVLPSHNEPFYGLHHRLDALINGHCAKLERLARKLETPKTALETLDTLFGRRFDNPMLLSMATGESIAHLRFLETAGLVERDMRGGVAYYCRTSQPSMTRLGFIEYSRQAD
ncbi:MAG: MBL fold metallo-hydrolase [Pseudomonadota bacterium]